MLSGVNRCHLACNVLDKRRRISHKSSIVAGTVGYVLTCCALSMAQTVPPTPGTGIVSVQSAPDPGAGTAQVSGTVQSEDGALLAGAQAVLTPARSGSGGPQGGTTKTDAAGAFVFGQLPPGEYLISVSLSGFSGQTRHVILSTGQALALTPITLSLGTVSISVDALTTEQASLQELHTEEQQRLVGLLPNFFVSYHWTAPPLTSRQKYTLATHTVFDPGNLVLAGLTAGVQQAANAFPGYGQGAPGYGKRFGANLANLAVGTYMGGAVLPSLFHQDPRYFYKGTGTKKSRFFYSVSRAVITRGDNGHAQPNFSGILGDLTSSAISNVYYPASDRQGGKVFIENSILAVAGDALTGFVQEFVLNHFTLNMQSRKNNKNQP